MKKLLKEKKEILLYLLFGICTTIVNILVYWVCAHPLGLPVMESTIIAWIMAVLIAYLTNRKWVFHSAANNRQEILREITAFFSCRIATGLVDWITMLVFVDLLHGNDLFFKAAANLIVIVLNYLASRFLIFSKK